MVRVGCIWGGVLDSLFAGGPFYVLLVHFEKFSVWLITQIGTRARLRSLLVLPQEHGRVICANRSDSLDIIPGLFFPLGNVVVTPLFLQPIQHLFILHVDSSFVGQPHSRIKGAGTL